MQACHRKILDTDTFNQPNLVNSGETTRKVIKKKNVPIGSYSIWSELQIVAVITISGTRISIKL